MTGGSERLTWAGRPRKLCGLRAGGGQESRPEVRAELHRARLWGLGKDILLIERTKTCRGPDTCPRAAGTSRAV